MYAFNVVIVYRCLADRDIAPRRADSDRPPGNHWLLTNGEPNDECVGPRAITIVTVRAALTIIDISLYMSSCVISL